MKLCLFETNDAPGERRTGAVVDGGVAELTAALGDAAALPPQARMEAVIDGFEGLRAAFERVAAGGPSHADGSFRLRAPLPRPGKILCCIGNYWEHAEREPRPLNMFLKSPDAVIGPGDTIVLPSTTDPWVFQHEAELAIVIGKTADHVAAEDAADYIFGYVNFMDVSAREINPNGNSSFFWQKSWDTFAPMGPAIVTRDEIEDAQDLRVQLWVNGEVRQDLSTSDMGRTCEEVLEFASWITTLQPGDVVSTGTNHVGLGPIQDGDVVDMEIEGLERLTVNVVDAWKRMWPRKTLSQMSAFESSVNSKRL